MLVSTAVISNEELYGRMRQQRMLREELREKKKELENMMRKDKPKKQNFASNQSDNVSFSNRSDPFTYDPGSTSHCLLGACGAHAGTSVQHL